MYRFYLSPKHATCSSHLTHLTTAKCMHIISDYNLWLIYSSQNKIHTSLPPNKSLLWHTDCTLYSCMFLVVASRKLHNRIRIKVTALLPSPLMLEMWMLLTIRFATAELSAMSFVSKATEWEITLKWQTWVNLLLHKINYISIWSP